MEFDKETAQNAYDALVEIMEAFPKKKMGEFLGHFNDALLFIGAAKNAAPEKEEKKS